MSKEKIDTPQAARIAVFERTGQFINQAKSSTMQEQKASMIWAVNDMIPYVNKASDINVSSLQFNCTFGGHTFNYSIAINVGEIRIGILIPESIQSNNGFVSLDNLDMYDYASEYSPKKILRVLTNGMFLDHIFNVRFGSVEVTYKAMAAATKDDKAIDILADAIAKELIHINHGLMHAFSSKGFLVMNTGIYTDDEKRIGKVQSKLSSAELLKKLGIQPVQLLPLDDESYMVIYPETDADIESKMDKMNADYNKAN